MKISLQRGLINYCLGDITHLVICWAEFNKPKFNHMRRRFLNQNMFEEIMAYQLTMILLFRMNNFKRKEIDLKEDF